MNTTTQRAEGVSRRERSGDGIVLLHQQIYSDLRRKIEDGAYSVGVQLPGEHELARLMDVSRVTIRKALARLEADGLVRRVRGVGAFPLANRAQAMRDEGVTPYSAHMVEASKIYTNRFTETVFLPTPYFLDASDAGFGDQCLKVVRVSSIRRKPVHLITSYFPARDCQGVDLKDFHDMPISQALRREPNGASTIDLYIEAVSSDADQARLLQTLVGSPLMRSVNSSISHAGLPLDYNIIYTRTDRFRYHFNSDERSGVIRAMKD